MIAYNADFLDNKFCILELLSLISFAISGAYYGISKKYDIFGIFIISLATSTSGGMLRDFFLGNFPVSWIRSNNYAYIILVASIFTIFYYKNIKHIEYIIYILDSIGLGIFTVLGIQYSIKYNLSPIIGILLGTINGSFGGIVRDILCGNNPVLFRKEIYATVCILGGILFFILNYFGLSKDYTYPITIIFIFITRILVIEYKIKLPSIY